MRCEVIGCNGDAAWRVADDRRTKNVCRKCRDELVAFGWHLVRSLYRRAV